MQDNSNTFERAPKPKTPKGFDSEEEFVRYVRDTIADDAEADENNRAEEVLDHQFVAGIQWDEDVYQTRISLGKPAMTVNRLPAYVSQVVGNRRLNETTIKVIADTDNDTERAKVREAIMRNITKNSRAKRVFNSCFQNQVVGGLGNFKVELDYVSNDVFYQDISICPIPNNTSVIWDRNSIDPTGADARHCAVIDRITTTEFKERYPDAVMTSVEDFTPGISRTAVADWYDKDTVKIAEFWRVLSRRRTLALLQDGKTVDITDLTDEDIVEQEMVFATRANGEPVVREAMVKYVQLYKVSGGEILEGPYELPISRVPVFKAVGWEFRFDDQYVRFGLIRFLRDPQRLHNIWRSIVAEKLIGTPKANWLAGKTAIEGYEDNFRRAHISDDPLLVWNDEAGPQSKPERVAPAQMEAALIQEASMASQDIKDVSNLHEASLGMQSNEVSGKAIMARQRVGETGTQIYIDNMNMAIEECGRVINELIPFVYDTPRVLKIMDETDPETVKYVRLNYDDGQSIDVTQGRYDITVVTGPSFETKRIEAAESMMAAVNAMPDVFSIAGDLIAEAQDWPGADKIAKRIRRRMPADLLGEDMSPEQQQAAQQEAMLAEKAAQIEMAEKEAEIAYKQAQTQELRVRAQKVMVEAEAARAKIRIEAEKLGLDAERLGLDADMNEAKIESMRLNDVLQVTDATTGENNV